MNVGIDEGAESWLEVVAQMSREDLQVRLSET
jgi:hypothetical protein